MQKQDAVIPLLRIFDVEKARAFYTGWLGFRVDWEQRHAENFPLYFQVSKDNIRFHLTGHYGDCTPGTPIYIEWAGDLAAHQAELAEKDYRYCKPAIIQEPWNDVVMHLTDPFGNRLSFAQIKPA